MNYSKFGVIDIESNGLLSDMIDYRSFPYKLREDARLWCVVVTNVETGEVKKAVKEEVTFDWLREALAEFDYIVAHNGIKFDFLALKLFGVFDYKVGYPGEDDFVFGRPVKFIDTLVISRLLNPDRYGGHSLDSWGERVGEAKTDFRAVCVEKGIIPKDAPKGAEFRQFCEDMVPYCEQDTKVNVLALKQLVAEMGTYGGWKKAMKMENKLADLGVRRENFGFWFDKELALKCLADLTEKMEAATKAVLPNLPLKKMNKTELAKFIPPATQLKKDGSLAAAIIRFAERVGAEFDEQEGRHFIVYKDIGHELPYHEPLETFQEPSMKDLDHIKMYLISLGWNPTEWRERDLTKDSKKQSLPYEKRVEALNRWFKETRDGKYTQERFSHFPEFTPKDLYYHLLEKLNQDWPVRVPTSPCVRVGVEKELCPNLTKLGDSVAFAKDFALYLTYKHRKNSIAGGEIEDMDFDVETPNTGYLKHFREDDHRIPTPAIEVGCNTGRMKHSVVCNIPRAESVYGKEMRSLFGSGPLGLQLGYDFSALEARIMGMHCLPYTNGRELADAMLAEKPGDVHTRNSERIGIPRSEVKSVFFMLIYGGSLAKLMKMLKIPKNRAQKIWDDIWNAMPALKELKEDVERAWEATGKKYIIGIDGRKIMTRSKHSLLNCTFQSGGVICAKYVNVFTAEKLEKEGYNIDPFFGQVDFTEMISYHDEIQYFINKKFADFERFNSEEEAKKFLSSWSGKNQLGAVTEGSEFYVTLPNPLSVAIEESIRKTEKELNLTVTLGHEWTVNKNWYGCH